MARRLAVLLVSMAVLAAPRARAGITIDIEGVDGELRANVLAFLSLERYKDSENLPDRTLERLQERAEREVRAALRPFGFYDPSVRTELQRERDGDVRARVIIDPGPPVLVSSVEVELTGPAADDPLFTSITRNPPLSRGDRLSHAAYERLKGDLQRTAATYGFLDARISRSDLIVDPTQRTARIALAMDTGRRYRFGPISLEQDVIRDELAQKYLRFREGEPFDATELLRTQFALEDSQYFSSVEVLPEPRDRESLEIPISVRATANRRDRYQIGLGYGTDTRTRVTASWDNRRVNARGHRFRTALRTAELEQRLEARYVVPIGDPALEKGELSLEWNRQIALGDIEEARSVELRPSVTQVMGRWQRVLFTIATRTTTDSVLSGRRADTLLIPGISYALLPRGYLGEELLTRTLYAELRGSSGFLGSDSDFVQLRMQAERVFDLAPRWHLFLRGELGASAVGQFSQLPASQRFFAGGDNSVRGFGYNDLSPYTEVRRPDPDDPDTILTSFVQEGGRHLFTGTVEIIRDLPRNFGVAAFVDAGMAFDAFGDPLAYSAGAGVRYRLPVLTLGIDIAQPISEPGPAPGVAAPDRSPRLHITFTPKL